MRISNTLLLFFGGMGLIFSLSAQAMVNNSQSIGTVLQPTIDGGQINEIRRNEIKQRGGKINRKSPKDEWVQSPLEKALEQAARDGRLEKVLTAIKLKKLPPSLALIPLVESGYQSQALSPRGAAGPWQLMPVVAKDYGISSNARFEWEASTEVALQLLSDLHDRFGNWELALAAYNAGSGRLTQALRQQSPHPSFEQLSLPAETKQYVAKIKALSHQVEQYAQIEETFL